MLNESGYAVSLGPNGLRCIQFNSIFAVLMLDSSPQKVPPGPQMWARGIMCGGLMPLLPVAML